MPRFTPTGSGLERARLAAGLTLSDVASAVTRDPQTVRRWETAKATPSRPVLLRLARLYDCAPTDLVDA